MFHRTVGCFLSGTGLFLLRGATMSQVISKPILLIFALAILSLAVFAQAPTGIITGTVTDETGAVAPNAKITITQKSTEFARAAVTNGDGFYSAPALPAGEHAVRCEHPGFRTIVRAA